jgi:Tfp pilus assembly protein PilX
MTTTLQRFVRTMPGARGAALPMVLLLMVVVSVLVAAAFEAASNEARFGANQESDVTSFGLAETGLEYYLANRDSLGFTTSPPAASESTRVMLSGGYADVVSTQVRKDSVDQRYGYVVRSHGVSTIATLSGTAGTERTVAEYATYQPGTMNTLSGWTSLSGIKKQGNAGELTGDDGCTGDTVAGVAVPTNPGYTGATGPVSGNPPIENLGTQAQAESAAGINWNGIINQGALTPDITIPPGTWPSSFPSTYWPVIELAGSPSSNVTLPGAGQGTLIVEGNLTISGNNMWDGILLVGGTLTSNGNNTVEGAVVSGLNEELGLTDSASSIGNGTKTYQYNSCNIAKAMTRFSQMVGYTNAWVDNWPTTW